MPDHFEKFVFLGAIVAIALLSRFAYPEMYGISDAASRASKSDASLAADAPMFIMPGTQSATNATTTAGTSTAGASSAMLGGETATDAVATTLANATSNSPFTQVGNAPVPDVIGEGSLVADLETERPITNRGQTPAGRSLQSPSS